MAIGDKKPVVMQSDRAVPSGIATLGTDGKLLDAQIPSLAKLEAAPAGYGLGGECVDLPDYDWNNALSNGFYRGKVNTLDGKWWFGEVITHSSYNIVQRVTRQFSSIADTTTQVWVERRVLSTDDGVTYEYGEWEFINPPMKLGVEYRTTERWNGKPVYVKAVKVESLGVGSSSSVGQKYFYVGPGIEEVVSHTGQYVYPDINSAGLARKNHLPIPWMHYDGTVLEIPVAPDTAIDVIWAEYVICRNSSGINVFPSGAGCPQVEFAEDNYDSSNVYIKVTNTGKLSGFKVTVLVKYTKA